MSSVTGNSDNIFINNANLKIAKVGKGVVFSDGSVLYTANVFNTQNVLSNIYQFTNAQTAFVINEVTANTGFAGNTAPTDAISVSSNLFISYTGNLITYGQLSAGSVANVESNILTLETDLSDNSSRIDAELSNIVTLQNDLSDNSSRIDAELSNIVTLQNDLSDNSSRIGLYESNVYLDNGNVGIGTSSPQQKFNVSGSSSIIQVDNGSEFGNAAIGVTSTSAFLGLSSPLPSSSVTNRWYIGARDDTSILEFNYTNTKQAGWNQFVTNKGYLSNVGSGQINFTGQHRTFIDGVPFTTAETNEGFIVSANKNDYIKMQDGISRGNTAITINESLPIVSLSNTMNDKRCFGVISGSEDPDKRTDAIGIFHTNYEKENGDTRVYVNSVGEGAIWVSNIAGNFESGDYITTSNIAGYGQLQGDDILHNYTVAKITMDCDFNPSLQPVKVIKKIPGTDENDLDQYGQIQWVDDPTETDYAYKTRDIPGTPYKAAFVGCTYHCG